MKTDKKTDKKLVLTATPRDIFGKRLRKLRKNGIVPANIYGPGFKSVALSVTYKDFIHTYKVAHETGVVYVQVNDQEIPVLIKHIQKHPVNDSYIHIDLRKIDLKQKIETEVPLIFIGDAPAVAQHGGVLLTQTDKVLIEALPTDIPEHIEIDLSTLTEIGSEIKIQDIAHGGKYEIKEEPEKAIVSVIVRREESITPETEAAAPEVITEKKDDDAGAEAPAEAAPAEKTEE